MGRAIWPGLGCLGDLGRVPLPGAIEEVERDAEPGPCTQANRVRLVTSPTEWKGAERHAAAAVELPVRSVPRPRVNVRCRRGDPVAGRNPLARRRPAHDDVRHPRGRAGRQADLTYFATPPPPRPGQGCILLKPPVGAGAGVCKAFARLHSGFTGRPGSNGSLIPVLSTHDSRDHDVTTQSHVDTHHGGAAGSRADAGQWH